VIAETLNEEAMDSVHDLGGTQGFGPVPHKANSLSYKPFFKYSWEPLCYCLAFAGAEKGLFTIDELRHAIERMEPRLYMTSPYSDRLIVAIASLYVEKGVLTQAELEEIAGGAFTLANPSGQGRSARPAASTFSVGDTVTVRNEIVPGHVRVPRYVRGKTGLIVHRTRVKWPLPDSAGHGMPAEAQHTYHVKFTTQELWGSSAEEGAVVVDLWEEYLEKC
jgi:nitrile hydratase subunit beta